MSVYFRRLYATLPKLPDSSPVAARELSSPIQVRRRKLRRQPSAPVAPEDSSTSLSLVEQARYTRLKRLGAFLREENGFREPTEEEWLADLNKRRTRIRGAVQRVVENPETGTTTTIEDVVGHRIYLPNIIFRMVRNYTPPGQPYNPWEATFRIPNSVTKLDVRSYLDAVYGVKCTYIRTDNYFAPIWRGKAKGHPYVRRTRKSYKRAVVGLVEPFYYPEALEDMDLEERQEREKWLERQFQIQRNSEMSRISKESWRPSKSFNLSGNRGAILRSVIAKRQEREHRVDQSAHALLQRNPEYSEAQPSS